MGETVVGKLSGWTRKRYEVTEVKCKQMGLSKWDIILLHGYLVVKFEKDPPLAKNDISPMYGRFDWGVAGLMLQVESEEAECKAFEIEFNATAVGTAAVTAAAATAAATPAATLATTAATAAQAAALAAAPS